MDINRILEYAEKIPKKLRLLTSPYQIGFTIGHFHLSGRQVFKIKQILNSNNSKDVVVEYEKRFAALIGPGYGVSFAAGRMAFYSLLKILNIGVGDEVILPGFTCSVMLNAICRVGAKPVFSDIDADTFGSNVRKIENKITSNTKLIVAQHSFGIPCRIGEIAKIGKKHGIFLMEDSAIALDSAINGIKVGNWGDASLFSTEHSKPLNTLMGGFLYTRNKLLYEKIRKFSETLPHLDKNHQARLYNQFLYERKNYTPRHYPRSAFMDSVRFRIRKINLKTPTATFLNADYGKYTHSNSNYPYPAKMPAFLTQLGLFELERWENEKQRRKNLLKKYISIMTQSKFDRYLPEAYLDPDMDIVPLRFVFQYPDARRLMKRTSRFIDVEKTWFREPVICCPEGPESLGYYYGSCPVSEKVGKHIINWPCVMPPEWESEILRLFHNVINS